MVIVHPCNHFLLIEEVWEKEEIDHDWVYKGSSHSRYIKRRN